MTIIGAHQRERSLPIRWIRRPRNIQPVSTVIFYLWLNGVNAFVPHVKPTMALIMIVFGNCKQLPWRKAPRHSPNDCPLLNSKALQQSSPRLITRKRTRNCQPMVSLRRTRIPSVRQETLWAQRVIRNSRCWSTRTDAHRRMARRNQSKCPWHQELLRLHPVFPMIFPRWSSAIRKINGTKRSHWNRWLCKWIERLDLFLNGCSFAFSRQTSTTSNNSTSSPTHSQYPLMNVNSNTCFLKVPMKPAANETITAMIDPSSGRTSNVTGNSKMTFSTFLDNLINPSRSNSLQKELKAARQLGMLVGVFTVSWLPYFILFLVVAWCNHCVSNTVFTASIWLGYLNSTFNPLIYPLCNMHFRRAFQKICHCKHAKTKLPNLNALRELHALHTMSRRRWRSFNFWTRHLDFLSHFYFTSVVFFSCFIKSLNFLFFLYCFVFSSREFISIRKDSSVSR